METNIIPSAPEYDDFYEIVINSDHIDYNEQFNQRQISQTQLEQEIVSNNINLKATPQKILSYSFYYFFLSMIPLIVFDIYVWHQNNLCLNFNEGELEITNKYIGKIDIYYAINNFLISSAIINGLGLVISYIITKFCGNFLANKQNLITTIKIIIISFLANVIVDGWTGLAGYIYFTNYNMYNNTCNNFNYLYILIAFVAKLLCCLVKDLVQIVCLIKN